MTLCELIKKLSPHRRVRTHVSKEFMYCLGIRIWDLNYETYNEQPQEIKEYIDKMTK